MRTVAFITLGCKVNQSETQGIQERFEQQGFKTVSAREKADVYVINTCAVTAMSESKSRQMISRAYRLNPQACIAVTGCYAQRAKQQLLEIPGVCIVAGTNHKSELPDMCIRYLQDKKRESALSETREHTAFEDIPLSGHDGHTRAYMKIQDGCNSYCSYCIIPFLRGPMRSRGLDSIAAEARRLSEAGFREIVLGGIHLTAYGCDNGSTLGQAVLASVVPGIRRIRLGSLEPMGITEDFLCEVEKTEQLCPHFHLSLQSGSKSVLARMNRRYTPKEYASVAEGLRRRYPDCALSTDVIVGFPGETQEEFEQTLRFVKQMGFAFVHVFAYSPREGTAAAAMPEQIAPQIKKEREHILMQQCALDKEKYLSGFVGRQEEVLIERAGKGVSRGLTARHAEAVIKGELKPGTMARAAVESVRNGVLQCTLIKADI